MQGIFSFQRFLRQRVDTFRPALKADRRQHAIPTFELSHGHNPFRSSRNPAFLHRISIVSPSVNAVPENPARIYSHPHDPRSRQTPRFIYPALSKSRCIFKTITKRKSGQIFRLVRCGSGRRIDSAMLVLFLSSLGKPHTYALPSLLKKSEPTVLGPSSKILKRKEEIGKSLPFVLVAGGGLEPPTFGL